MNELVKDSLTALNHQIAVRGVKVVVRPLPPTIADRMSMEQIVANLLGNAVKYVDPERSGLVEISGHRFPDENVYVIRDSGRGIDKGHLTRIFHVFQRVGETERPRRRHGTGPCPDARAPSRGHHLV